MNNENSIHRINVEQVPNDWKVPPKMERFLSGIRWWYESDNNNGFHIVTIDPILKETVQVAWCATVDNAKFVVGRLNRRF